METFSALLAICEGNSPVPDEFPTQRPVTRSFDILFYMRLNKRLSKQSCGWWFETPSRSLWRHRDVVGLWRGMWWLRYSRQLWCNRCRQRRYRHSFVLKRNYFRFVKAKFFHGWQTFTSLVELTYMSLTTMPPVRFHDILFRSQHVLDPAGQPLRTAQIVYDRDLPRGLKVNG